MILRAPSCIEFILLLKTSTAEYSNQLSISNLGSFKTLHNNCVKSVQIQNFFWSAFSHIQFEYGKIRTRKNDTSHTVDCPSLLHVGKDSYKDV